MVAFDQMREVLIQNKLMAVNLQYIIQVMDIMNDDKIQ